MFKINGIGWMIKQVSSNHPKLRRTSGEYALASCDEITHTIYISINTPIWKLKKVLCHEITHAAMFSYKVYMTVD